MFTGINRRKGSGHKQHICLFCGDKIWKPPRHLERNHKLEIAVQKALVFPVGSKERREEWQTIIRKIDFEHNIKLLISNDDGEIANLRSANENKEKVPCPRCFGFLSSKTLHKHLKECKLSTTTDGEDRLSQPLAFSRALLGMVLSDGRSQEVHKALLANMHRDELHLVIRKDESLMLLAQVHLQHKDDERHSDIRHSLRCLAKVLLQLRAKNNEASGKVLVYPENFDEVISVSKSMAGYKGPRDIAKPSTMLKIGYSLRHLALVVRAVALKSNDEDLMRKVRGFLELYESDWQPYANNCKSFMHSKKANKPEEMLLEEDVKQFRDFVISGLQDFEKKEELSSKELRKLMRLTIARLLTFNARRGAEVSKLTLDIWQGVSDGRWKRQSDIEKLEDPLERTLANKIQLCYLEGKRKAKGKKNTLVPYFQKKQSMQSN